LGVCGFSWFLFLVSASGACTFWSFSPWFGPHGFFPIGLFFPPSVRGVLFKVLLRSGGGNRHSFLALHSLRCPVLLIYCPLAPSLVGPPSSVLLEAVGSILFDPNRVLRGTFFGGWVAVFSLGGALGFSVSALPFSWACFPPQQPFPAVLPFCFWHVAEKFFPVFPHEGTFLPPLAPPH